MERLGSMARRRRIRSHTPVDRTEYFCNDSLHSVPKKAEVSSVYLLDGNGVGRRLGGLQDIASHSEEDSDLQVPISLTIGMICNLGRRMHLMSFRY